MSHLPRLTSSLLAAVLAIFCAVTGLRQREAQCRYHFHDHC